MLHRNRVSILHAVVVVITAATSFKSRVCRLQVVIEPSKNDIHFYPNAVAARLNVGVASTDTAADVLSSLIAIYATKTTGDLTGTLLSGL